MTQLRHYSMTPHDKSEWLLRLQLEVSQQLRHTWYRRHTRRLAVAARLCRCFIRSLYTRRDINVRSEITADLMTEDGETRLLIKRNGKLLQVYYIKQVDKL
ncbi:hypothetical protein [Segatella oris]|uniref:hypothetical protein n=1 Tax=Segatella oris TaxID=28135 RepID=UPI0028F04510|nr:hypothetical protein [Segatella oris]